MFESAEKYARERILPFVSTYTPRFISNFIAPTQKPKYLPLHDYDSSTSPTTIIEKTTKTPRTAKTTKTPKTTTTTTEPPHTSITTTTTSTTTSTTETATTTPYTNIQKISRKLRNNKDKSAVDLTAAMSERIERDEGRVVEAPPKRAATTVEPDSWETTAIYIDLPVFEESESRIKYIPVSDFKSD